MSLQFLNVQNAENEFTVLKRETLRMSLQFFNIQNVQNVQNAANAAHICSKSRLVNKLRVTVKSQTAENKLTPQNGEEGLPEAVVSHTVGRQADVHAGVLVGDLVDDQLVEVGPVSLWVDLVRLQHPEPTSLHYDSRVGVVHNLARVELLQPLLVHKSLS